MSLFLPLLPLTEPKIMTRSALPPMGNGYRQKRTALSVAVDTPLTASETHSLANPSTYLEDDSDGTDRIVASTLTGSESGNINWLHQSAHEIQGVHIAQLLQNVLSQCFV